MAELYDMKGQLLETLESCDADDAQAVMIEALQGFISRVATGNVEGLCIVALTPCGAVDRFRTTENPLGMIGALEITKAAYVADFED